jgi:protein TonB
VQQTPRRPFARFLVASLLVHAMAGAALYRADVEQRRAEAARRAGRPGLLALHLIRLPEGPPAAPAPTPEPVAVARSAPAKPASPPRPTAKPAPAPEPAPQQTATAAPETSADSAQATGDGSAQTVALANVATGPLAGQIGDGGSAGDLEAALARYEELLARLIAAHKQYPALARRRGIEGSVLLRLSIDASGRLAALDTPGRAPLVLAAQARSAAERAAPFPPPPNGDLRIDFVLRFDLDD